MSKRRKSSRLTIGLIVLAIITFGMLMFLNTMKDTPLPGDVPKNGVMFKTG